MRHSCKILSAIALGLCSASIWSFNQINEHFAKAEAADVAQGAVLQEIRIKVSIIEDRQTPERMARPNGGIAMVEE